MLKKTLIILFLAGFACAKPLSISDQQYLDVLFDQAVAELMESFNKIPREKTPTIEGIGILPFKGDVEEKFYNRLKSGLTNSRFFMYERNEIDKLLINQGIQQEDFYSKKGRLKIGNLTQWKGLVFGTLQAHTENFLGKRKVYIEVHASFDNLETGQIAWAENRTYSTKVSYPIMVYLVVTIGIFVLIYLLNWSSKGRYVTKIATGGIIFAACFAVWFFVI